MLQTIWRKAAQEPASIPPAELRPRPHPGWPALLFVCTANRIRSPLAEHMLLDLLARHDTPPGPWRVESAGIWAQEGLPVLPAVQKAGLELGLDLDGHRARAVAGLDLTQFDLILTMERRQATILCNEFPQLRPRIMTLGEAVSGYEFEIVDPPGHAPRAIRATAKEVAEILAWGIERLQARLEASKERRRFIVVPH